MKQNHPYFEVSESMCQHKYSFERESPIDFETLLSENFTV